jgi:hypothetical protein
LNAQLDGQNNKPIQHADEITSARQKWQFATPSYYIPKAIVPSRLTLIVG